MHLSQKLDALMGITNTTNSMLARYVSLDPSYISRLRSGARMFIKKETREEYFQSMATYFARHCTLDYQRKALYDLLKINPFSYDEDEIAEAIYEWLLVEDTNAQTVGSFLEGLSSIKFGRDQRSYEDSPPAPVPRPDTSVYYGVQGKRQAAVDFLSEVIQHETPQTLLLFSDEDIEWLVGDRQFTLKWTQLMTEIVLRGNRIRIIHVVSRDLDEMLAAIAQWMPLYMSGAIEPYFYPKKRDGIFRRTLFIAPETAAVVSTSVGSEETRPANFLFRDKETIRSFVDEYNAYFKMCRPLMKIFTAKDRDYYISTLVEFEREETNSIISTNSISILTMPESLVHDVFAEFGPKEKGKFLNEHRLRRDNFEKQIQSHLFTEIMNLPDVSAVKEGRVKIASSDMLSMSSAYYTPEQYIKHLEHIIYLVDTYPNFHVSIDRSAIEDRSIVYAKEDLGVIIAKTSVPTVAMAINESNLTAAFWDYLRMSIDDRDYANSQKKKEVASTLREFADHIKRS